MSNCKTKKPEKMVRISQSAHDALCQKARTEGRKIQFMVDTAIRHYVGLQASEKPDSSQDDSQFIQAPGSLAG